MLAVGLLSCILSVSAPSSVGCGTTPPASPGETAELSITDQGTQRTFYLHVPAGYDSSRPTAIILAFHGWNGNGLQLLEGMTPQSDHSNFVVVAPNGLAENLLPSWNGGGTTQPPGPRGPTCDVKFLGSTRYCYTSCAARPEGCHPCDWTTCNDDIAFADALLDWIETHLCVDLAKVFAVGFSNGATFTYTVSAALSHRISAFVANSGTPHPGYERSPTNVQSVMDIHAVDDTTCPGDNASPGPNGSPPGQRAENGWYYLDVISTLKLWLNVLLAAQISAGCGGDPHVDLTNPPAFSTSADGDRGLSCVRLSSGCSTDESLDQHKVVRCSWVGGHHVHPRMPRIAWEFFTGTSGTSDVCAEDDFSRSDDDFCYFWKLEVALALLGVVIACICGRFCMVKARARNHAADALMGSDSSDSSMLLTENPASGSHGG